MLFVISLAIAITGAWFWRAAAKKVKEERNPVYKTSSMVFGGVSIVFALVALSRCFVIVEAGHVGVVDVFGVVSESTLKSGINMVNPMANVFTFSVKTQELKELMDVPSKEGLTVQLEVSALFHLNPEKAAEVYKTVGPDFVEIILVPQFRSVARGVTAGYDARALYTSEREMLAQTVLADLQKLVEPRGITIESTPLRRVGLPPGLTQSIEEKLRSEQESQRMQFVLAKERQEAERKRIEAQGVADFQNIVAKGISEQLLKWKGIEATEKLATSQNAKIVVIGSGKNGLPIILNEDGK